MQEKYDILENIIKEISKEIEDRLFYEQKNLGRYDEMLKEYSLSEDADIRERIQNIKSKIITYKNDTLFWSKDIPNLITLLQKTIEKITGYEKDLRNIGGRDLPNIDIIKLIKRGILTSETLISRTYKGKEIIGHLTTDGFLEIELNGSIQKMSLRRAALNAWGTNPFPNQWSFWEVLDDKGEKYNLEHFKNLLSGGE